MVVLVVVVVTLVTKNSSVPTFSTAFWLFSVAMRGLESTCTLPWDSRKVSSDAKLEVCSASPNTAPAGLAVAKEPEVALIERPVGSAITPPGATPVESTWPRAPSCVETLELVESWPIARWRLKMAQLMPAW